MVLFCISHTIRNVVAHLFMSWISSLFAFVHTMRSYLLPSFIRSWTFYYCCIVALHTFKKSVLSLWRTLQILTIVTPINFLLYHPLFPSEHLFQYVTTLCMYFYVLCYCTTASIEILSCLLLYSQHPVQAQTHSLCSSNIFLMNK